MLTNLFSNTTSTFSITALTISSVVSIILGFLIAITHKYTSKYTKGYLTTISILPFLVQIVILLVNGNLGTGIAIMGAFSLVRFRSLPGNAKEILTVFFSMTIGLTIGCGYVVFASLVTIIGCLFLILYEKTKLFDVDSCEKILNIIIPEDLDYTQVFDDIFEKYTKKVELQKVKTVDMGSMFQLKYLVLLKDKTFEKEFIDDLRIRNGNLKIILSHSLEDSDL